MRQVIFIFLFYISISCSKNNYKFESNLWHHKDVQKDSVYGVSLNKWHAYNKHSKRHQKQIIVAVLDTQIDLNHEALKGKLWKNEKEIPNNNIDDDNNGYIDDVDGWNFVGIGEKGYFSFGNFEYTRIVREDSLKKILINNEFDKTQLKKAKEALTSNLAQYKQRYKNGLFLIENFESIKDSVQKVFRNDKYFENNLDSIFNLYNKDKIPYRKKLINKEKSMTSFLGYAAIFKLIKVKNVTDIQNINNQYDSIINFNLNINFDDQNFKIHNKDRKHYGNNVLNSYSNLQEHSTLVSGIIAGNGNTSKINGFHNSIQIMPLSISVSGDEHDDDIAKAIYYAVDNGAKIINMSFGKEFSLSQQQVTEAFKYAEKNNVLIVHISGNDAMDIDTNTYYPNDFDYYLQKEVVTNFINVGAISVRNDSTMVAPFSNYGKENVDIFAPGEDILVARPNNQYEKDSGTSIAGPMVSGTAALIWLYYPNLSAQEVKQIILESGVVIDKKVIKPGTKDEMVSFSELCKSGKILNTYNAMQMAKKMSEKRKSK